jgi:alginate O-acetyltransferase complex protein AlgI
MTFTELPFWILTAVVFGLWLVWRRNYRATVCLLLTGSLVFYSYHRWSLLPLVLLYCLVDWAVACWIARSSRPRVPLTLGVTFNLLVLAYWKYTPLLLRTAAKFLLALDVPAPAAPQDWIIPFGISFYAFTGIAYLVDVYRRVTPVETSLFRYTLSALFFPHLVAGPILRPNEFLERLRPDAMPVAPESPLEALHLLARGCFKKMVLADRLALAIDPFFVHVGNDTTAGVWALPYVYLYAWQIYFDFSGYTDLARGLGLLFGFRWPENFDLPYLATSIQDFWRCWHMTLSRFLKDYLYLPLGGSRGPAWRTHVNLMLTMLLGGLWHGASWSFLLWGGLHGAFLVVNRVWSGSRAGRWLAGQGGVVGAVWGAVGVTLTFHCVCLAWCFFRLTNLTESLACVRKCWAFEADKLLVGGVNDVSLWLLLAAYGVLTGLAYLVTRYSEALTRTPVASGFRWGFGAALLVLAVLLSPGGDAPPFIYFQF